MANKANKAAAKAARIIATANANPNMLVGSAAQPVTNKTLWAFINAHGGPNNVTIKPLANVVMQNGVAGVGAIPFGYNGKPTGVRITIQNWLLNGYKGNRTYAAIMGAAKPLGHSSHNPTCLYAMLNGGYSPSSPHYGTPYVALVGKAVVAKPQPKVAKAQPAPAAATPAPAAAITLPAMPAAASGNVDGTGN